MTKLLNLPPETLRIIVGLATQMDDTCTFPCLVHVYPDPGTITYDTRLPASVRNSDKLAVALVCQRFWQIACEFLYKSVSVSSLSQMRNLAAGLQTRAMDCEPTPGSWIRKLEIFDIGFRSTLDIQHAAYDLTTILKHCSQLKALRVVGLVGHHNTLVIEQILEAVPTTVTHYEWDVWEESYNDLEPELLSTPLNAFLTRVGPTLQVLRIPRLQHPSLLKGLSNTFNQLSHLELRSFDLLTQECTGSPPNMGDHWLLQSLSHLGIEVINTMDIAAYNTFFSRPCPQLRSVRFGKLILVFGFKMRTLLESANNLEEIKYWASSSLRGGTWEDCSSKSLKRIILCVDKISSHPVETQMFNTAIRHHVNPLCSRMAFPYLQDIIIDGPESLVSDLIENAFGGLSDVGIKLHACATLTGFSKG